MFDRAVTHKPSLMARILQVDDWKLTLGKSIPDRLQLTTSVEEDLRYVDLKFISITKGLLWHGIELRSINRSVVLSGLSRKAAERLVADVLNSLNSHLVGLITSDVGQLEAIDNALLGGGT